MHFLHLSHLHFSLASLRDNLPHQAALTVLRRLPVPSHSKLKSKGLAFVSRKLWHGYVVD